MSRTGQPRPYFVLVAIAAFVLVACVDQTTRTTGIHHPDALGRTAIPSASWGEEAGKFKICNFNAPGSYIISKTGDGQLLDTSLTISDEDSCMIVWQATNPGDTATVTVTETAVAGSRPFRMAIIGGPLDGVHVVTPGVTVSSRVTADSGISIWVRNVAIALAPTDSDTVLAANNFDWLDHVWAVGIPNSLRDSSGYAVRGSIDLITGRGGSGKALRFNYTDSTTDNLIEKAFDESQDIALSYWYRTSVGADPTCDSINGSGLKWFMAFRDDGFPRYTMGVGLLAGGPADVEPQAGLEFTSHDNGSVNQPNPFLQNISKTPRFATTNDGSWHQYALQIVTGDSGYTRIWIDGTLVSDDARYRYDHDSHGILYVQFPGSMVSMPQGCPAYTIDIDDLKIWRRQTN